MADVLREIFGQIDKRYRDMGDGSYAEVVSLALAAAGGADTFRSIDLDESEEQVKGSGGVLYGGIVLNMSASVRYMKFYDAPAAAVTVGTTTPLMTIPIPTNGDTNGSGWTPTLPICGVGFDNGITVAVTTGLADNDTGAPGANEIVVVLWYK